MKAKEYRIFTPVLGLLAAAVLAACGANTGPANTPVLPTNPPASGVEQSPAATDTTDPAPIVSTDTVQVTETAPSTRTAAETGQSTKTVGNVPSDSVSAFPDPANFTWEPVISGLAKPLDLTSPPDASGRLFILEQPGIVRVYQDGGLLPDPFLDIRRKVRSSGSEQGLLGLAFHPNYAQNGFFYINYTGTNGDTVIARYNVSGDANRADPNSEQVLLQVDQPYANHNGGGMAFGPDGFLYMSLGDGGSAGDPQGNAQSLDTLLGKLLRVDVDSQTPYAIPADNPFASSGGLPEIWAYGLRNPWRFSFDRLTGDLYIADVGQNQWEEIDFTAAGEPGGQNYGWDYLEGTHPFEGEPPADVVLVDPVHEYQHGFGCSVTGGYVYRGEDLPEFRGIYLFSDFCSGRVWGLLRAPDGSWQSQELFQTGLNVTSFGQDQQGEIYLMDQPSGTVYRLQRR